MNNINGKMRGTALVLMSVLLVGTGAVSEAQYRGALGTQWNNPMSATLSVSLNNSMNASLMRQSLNSSMIANQILQRQRTGAGRSKGSATKRNTPSARKQTRKKVTAIHRAGTDGPRAATSFQAKPGHLLPERMAEKLAKNEDERKKMAILMHQCITTYENQAMARQGVGRFSDLWDLERIVSDAIAVNYAVYTQQPGATKQQFEQVRRTVGKGIRNNPRLARLTDEQKQEMYEMLAIMTSFVQIAREAAARSGAADHAKGVREMAGSILSSLTGAPAEKISLTSAGLTIQRS